MVPETADERSSNEPDSSEAKHSVLAAAAAAKRVKDACTIDEAELLSLRPTLLKGYASLQNGHRWAVRPFALYNSLLNCQVLQAFGPVL